MMASLQTNILTTRI